MLEKATKKVGSWTLLKNESSSGFLKYAKMARPHNSVWRDHYNNGIFKNFIVPNILSLKIPQRVAIDIGANYGFMTQGLLKTFNHVHAFEVAPDTRYCLEQNMGNHPRCTIHDCGIGPSNEPIEINFYSNRAGHSSVLECEDTKKHAKKILCKVSRLDSLNIENIDFIKIDVEGYELEVLKGCEGVLKEQSPHVLVELWNNDIENIIKVGAYMNSLGYTLSGSHNYDYLFSKLV